MSQRRKTAALIAIGWLLFAAGCGTIGETALNAFLKAEQNAIQTATSQAVETLIIGTEDAAQQAIQDLAGAAVAR